MSEATPAPVPAPAPAPAPVAPPPFDQGNPEFRPDRLQRYLDAFAAKKQRMKSSWRRSAVVLLIIMGAVIGATAAIGELHPYFKLAFDFIVKTAEKNNIPPIVPVILSLSIPAFILIQIIQLVPAVLVWWERKVAAHMQGRLGPMDVGGWHGWAQTIADGIKLFLKEIIEPVGYDKWPFRLAPLIVFLPSYLAFAPLPFGDGLVALDFDIGLLYVMAISGLSTIGILMAGWGSNNKFSLLGGLRAAAQVVSFEIPRVMSIVPVVMWTGTLSLSKIAAAQTTPLWGFFPRWFIFYPIVGQVAFVVYLITTIAETNRVPFDIPEAESELVAGFHTEYGGMKFAIFFLSEYAYVFVGSLLGTVLFLGGGSAPLPFLEFIPSWAWFLFKTLSLIFVFLWARWTFPRLRVDRVMDLCWKIFLPWTLINIVLMGVLMFWRLH
jgi:NADH-quinone oxidoreductase subunit H